MLPDNGHECKDWIAALARAGVDGYSPTTRGPAPNVAALVSHSPFGFTSRSCTADGPARADGSGPSSYVTLLVSTGSSAQPLWTHVTSDLPAMAPCASPAPTQTADGSKPHLGLQPCVPKREMAATGASDGVLHGPDQGGGQDPMDVLTNLYLLYGPAQTVLELNVDGEAPADLDALRDKAFAATWAYLTGS